MASKAKAAPRSLTDFVLDLKRVDCPMCALPEDIRAQLAAARTKKILRPDQIKWLREEVGIEISSADFDRHHSGRHERV